MAVNPPSAGQPDSHVELTVLVVDDDRSLQEVLETALEMEGYRVLLASDAFEAIEKIRAEAPSIILFDMFLPRMDGVTFAEELSRLGFRPKIPIVAVTGDDRGRQKANQIGAEGFLAKPFTIPDLLNQVAMLTGRSGNGGG
jgi:CheY-like chemotaxis protein